MPSRSHTELCPRNEIVRTIVFIRGRRVILDHDRAAIYGVTTSRLNEQVKRNVSRFPEDFAFRLNAEETLAANLSQSATGSQKHRDPGKPPHAFTEHGAIMASTVLNSSKAIQMSLYVVRAFVELREFLASNKELARRLDELETRLDQKVTGHDKAITAILAAIRQLMAPVPGRKRGIGFTADIEPPK
jgi:ATP-dependent Clp protease ATP-binding subunit ClpA